jgi:hypothetical protein
MEDPCPQVVHRTADTKKRGDADAPPRSWMIPIRRSNCPVRLAQPSCNPTPFCHPEAGRWNSFARMKIRRPKDL